MNPKNILHLTFFLFSFLAIIPNSMAVEKYYYHINDHLGNCRVVVDEQGEVEHAYDYYPFGKVLRTGGGGNKEIFTFTGKELDEEGDLDWYYFGARFYDPEIGRWMSVDPLADMYSSWSPYNYCLSNPLIFIDPEGKNPIYDETGNFLGTDDRGLMGEAIVMNAGNFTQGMTNDAALKSGTLFNKFEGSEKIKKQISSHFSGLSERPDWDGVVTIAEGIAWAKSHPNNSGTPNDALYLDALKMDFGSLSIDDFKKRGESKFLNLYWKTNLLSARSRLTTYALGQTKMTLVNPILGGIVRVENGNWNVYDWNYGGGLIRNTLIFLNRAWYGLNDSHGFPVHVYGLGLLNR